MRPDLNARRHLDERQNVINCRSLSHGRDAVKIAAGVPFSDEMGDNGESAAGPKILKRGGDNVSVQSSFIANAHNAGKGGLLEKKLCANRGAAPSVPSHLSTPHLMFEDGSNPSPHYRQRCTPHSKFRVDRSRRLL